MAKCIDVAVGVIVDKDKTLLAFRDGSKHQGNRYEFAGGKVEPHEKPVVALRRELDEELGIVIEKPIRLMQINHNYGDKQVNLHVFLIKQFRGSLGAVGQEGQALTWVNISELHQYPLPDANKTIVEFLQQHYLPYPLPHLCCISYPLSAFESNKHWLAYHVNKLPPHTLCYVRPQAPKTTENETTELEVIKQLLAQRTDIQAVVNSRFRDALLAYTHQIKMWHLNHAQLMQLEPSTLHQHTVNLSVGQGYIASCHDAMSIQKANQLMGMLTAILLSPVCATVTHPEAAPLGWQGFARLAQQSHLPVYALGGIKPADLARVWQHGGYGIAGIRYFLSDKLTSTPT